jgi:hypothetical protein
MIIDSKVVFNEPDVFSPPPMHTASGATVTPPLTAGGAIDPDKLFHGLTDGEFAQDFIPPPPNRKRLQTRTQSSVGSSPKFPTFAVDPQIALPLQMPWVPEREQDTIWHAEHYTVNTKTPWAAFPFARFWYSSG